MTEEMPEVAKELTGLSPATREAWEAKAAHLVAALKAHMGREMAKMLATFEAEGAQKRATMAKMMAANRPSCPECGGRMVRDGWVWSGRQRVQRWACTGCGRRLNERQAPPQTLAAEVQKGGL